MKKIILLASLFLAVLTTNLFAQTVVLQIGSNAPTNSPWDIGLKKMAAEWSKVSGGKVRVVFPKSVANSSAADMIQKMKFSLSGCVLETAGLGLIDPDAMYLSMPSVIKTDEQFDKAIEATTKIFKERYKDRYEFVAFAKAGGIRFFSNTEIRVPNDLKNIRMGVNREMDSLIKLLQSIGARTVNSDSASTLLQFNSNSLDAMYTSPLYVAALWPQYKKAVSYMSPFTICPFYGAIVVNKKDWNRIPSDLQEKLRESAEKMCKEIGTSVVKLENDGIASMKKGGLKIPSYTQEDQKKWDALYKEKLTEATTMFSSEFVQAINKAVGK